VSSPAAVLLASQAGWSDDDVVIAVGDLMSKALVATVVQDVQQ
jgi:hypothetical protein